MFDFSNLSGVDFSALLNPAARQSSFFGQNTDFMDYFNKYPDLQAEWQRLLATGAAGARGWTRPEQYAQWHWQTRGQFEGRVSPQTKENTPAVEPLLSEAVQLTNQQQQGTRIPQRSDPVIQDIAKQARIGEQRRSGRQATMLTSGAGVTNPFLANRPRLRQTGILG